MFEGWRDRTTQRDVLLLTVGTILCLLPFLDKAVHLDDPVYVWIARQIHVAPGDFFGFAINWHGNPAHITEFNRNPPGVSFLLAAAAWLGGWNEPALHLGILPAALAVVLGTWMLARRCCGQPLLAAAIAAATPAFVVSSTTLMADVPMLACWVWSMVYWERGMRQGSTPALLAAALLAALAMLTKFIAVSLLPLLLAWALLRERRPRLFMLWLLLPIAVLMLFDAYTVGLYGRGVLSDAAGYAADVGSRIPLLHRLTTALAFVGGTLLTTALYLPWLGSLRGRIAVLATIPLFVVLVLSFDKLGFTPIHWPAEGIRWGIVLHVAVFAAAALPLLSLCFAELRRPPGDGIGWMLAAWLLGTFTFAAIVNWTVSTRVILPMAPAAGILVARGLERAGVPALGWRIAPLAIGLVISLAVARADQQWAESARVAARDLVERYGGETDVQFQGHWGFQYYMEQYGARPFDFRERKVVPGNWLIEPCNNTNVAPFPPSFGRFVETARYPSSRWITVHNPNQGVGFYASSFGPLPWALGAADPEAYDVLQLRRPPAQPGREKARICGTDGLKR